MDTYDLKQGASYRLESTDFEGLYSLWRYESGAYNFTGQSQKFDYETLQEFLEKIESQIQLDEEACGEV